MSLSLEKRPAPRRLLLQTQLGLATRESQLEREIAIRRKLVGFEPGNDEAVLALAGALERAGRAVEAAELVEKQSARARGNAHRVASLSMRAAALREAAAKTRPSGSVTVPMALRASNV
jgi:hypothetical protein